MKETNIGCGYLIRRNISETDIIRYSLFDSKNCKEYYINIDQADTLVDRMLENDENILEYILNEVLSTKRLSQLV